MYLSSMSIADPKYIKLRYFFKIILAFQLCVVLASINIHKVYYKMIIEIKVVFKDKKEVSR